jgi:hypothetical protein
MIHVTLTCYYHVIHHITTASDGRLFVEQNKQIPWPSVRKRTIPTERPLLVDEI